MKHFTNNVRTLNIVCIAIFIAIALLLFILTLNFVNTRSYIKTDATVLAMKTNVDYGFENDSKSSLIKSVNCCYEYNNEKYESSYRTFFKSHSSGSKISVYLNPKKPSEIKDSFVTEVCILGIVFLVCFFALLSISQRNKYEK